MQKKLLSKILIVLLGIYSSIFLYAQSQLYELSQMPSYISSDDINKSFDQFKHDFLENYWRFNSDYAVYSGRYEFDHVFLISNQFQRQANREFLRYYKYILENYFDSSLLSQKNSTDYTLIQNEIDSTQWYLDIYKKYTWDPSVYSVARVIGLILNTEYNTLEHRLMAIATRLLAVPEYYSWAKFYIKTPTKEHTELAIAQSEGSLKLFTDRLPEAINKSELNKYDKQYINLLLVHATSAVQDYINWLKSNQSHWEQEGYRNFRIGSELYEQKFKYDINSSYSAKELYNLAVAEKNKLHKAMIGLSKKLWPKYFPDTEYPSKESKFNSNLEGVKQVIDKLALDHVKPEEFVDAVKNQIPQLNQFVINNNLLEVDSSKPLIVRETPEYQRGVAGASIESPGPYDSSANTYYNVDPLNGYNPEAAESLLREYNNYTLQILNIHEAIPGHYNQLMHSNKSPSLIKSIFGNGAMIEGWAVYSERMMLEQGYGDNSPELWLMYYKWNLRTVINTILDYSVHVLNMSKQEAMDLLINQGFQEPQEAEGKWRRATLTQVQLTSYFNGYKEIYDFRERYKANLENKGEIFNLTDFHNEFLSYGSAPVKVIKDLMS